MQDLLSIDLIAACEKKRHDQEIHVHSVSVSGMAAKILSAEPSESSTCSLHPSMIYSDIVLPSHSSLSDQLNQVTTEESFISTFSQSSLVTSTSLLHRIQQLHDKMAFVRIGNDLFLESSNHHHPINESLHASNLSSSSVSPIIEGRSNFFSSNQSLVRKIITKIRNLGCFSPRQDDDASIAMRSSHWWSTFSTRDWDRIKDSYSSIYPALESEFLEFTAEEVTNPRDLITSENTYDDDEDNRKRIELILATLLDEEEKLFQTVKINERTKFVSEMTLIALLLSMGIHTFLKRS